MSILFLTHRVPYPPDKGDRIRSYNIIKFLARNHSISLMSVTHEAVRPASREALEKLCDSVQIVEIKPTVSNLKSACYLLSTKPLTLPAFYSRRFHKAVRDQLEQTKFDLIYVYSSSMAQYVLDAGPIAKVMDFIDVDSQKWLDYAARARQPMKAIYHREGTRLRAFEKIVASRCQLNLFTTDGELKIFKMFSPDAPAVALPNGVDLTPTPSDPYRPNRLVFIGSMDYFPNVDAMIYFTGEILPLVQKELPDVELFIVGRNPSREVRALARLKNVTVTGDVEDVGLYLHEAAATVIPLRIARGMQTKLLEAMAHGVPAITTSAALDGIAAKPGTDVLVANSAKEFAEKTVAVLKDNRLRAQLAANGRLLVERQYRWETRLQNLEEAIASISLKSENEQLRQAVQKDLRCDAHEKSILRRRSAQARGVQSEYVGARRSSGTTQVSPFQRPVNLPFVSFIIPAKNEEKMIGQCLDAINHLDYDPACYECIVVDNGSLDDTAKVARLRGAKVLTLPERTIAALRNFGAKAARGEYLAFIDADCVVDTDWLKHALPHFEDPGVGCVGSHPDIPKESTWVQKTWQLQNKRYADVEEVDWLPSMNMLVSNSAFVETGGFKESLATCEDVDFCYRLKTSSKIVSDGKIASIHFGEARTVSEFFRKERWRGQGNLAGMRSHGFYWRELPSLLLPIYYLIAMLSLPVAAVSAIKGSRLPLALITVAIALPSLLLSSRTSLRVGDCTRFVHLAFLYVVYSVARAAAIARFGNYRESSKLYNCSKSKM